MTAWETYRQRVDAAAARKGDSFIDAQAIVRRTSPQDVAGILARLTQREIDKARDLYELTRPRPASRVKPDMAPTFKAVLDKPEKLYQRGGIYLNSAERRKFERWCRDQGHDFADWLDRLFAAVPEKSRDAARLDWIPGYRTPDMAERDRQFWQTTVGYVEQFAQNIRLEVTAELLGQKFTLPDGRKVTWADATRDDHERQLERLGQKLGDTAHRAAMHQRAIELLCAHDAKTLGELKSEAA